MNLGEIGNQEKKRDTEIEEPSHCWHPGYERLNKHHFLRIIKTFMESTVFLLP